MIEALWQGLVLVFQWEHFGYLMFGVALGIWIGAMPGVGAVLGLVVLLPFTYGMTPISAFSLLIGMWSVTTTSDTIASVMLGIPGSAASQATILDGYPLAQQGQAARALGAAYTVSAVGGVLGAAVLVISIPLILPIIMSFQSPELFMLGMLALTMVGSLSGSSILKGITAALLGLLLGTIGMAETAAVPRYTFGSLYLMDELPTIPVVLGLFAIPELMELAIKNVSISRVQEKDVGSGIVDGIKDAGRHWWLALRCGLLGTYIGMLPGLGGSIVDWVAYGHAVQSAKDKSRFGKGDIRGVIAPEAANNALKGGSLIPTLAVGIPGSVGAAILLEALSIHGLRPGPLMLTKNLNITLSLVWMIAVANVAAALLLMFLSRQIAKISFIPGHLIVPGVIMLVFMGAWLGGGSMGDWVTCLVMGFLGYVMKSGGWPRPPLILALILGNILENAFQLSNQVYDGGTWLIRPIVLALIALILLTLFLSIRGMRRTMRAREADPDMKGEGSDRNPVVSLPFSIVLVGLFLYAGLASLEWPAQVRQFPIAIAIPALFLSLAALRNDWREFVRLRETVEDTVQNDVFATVRHGMHKALAFRSGQFFGYLIAMMGGALVVGQKIAIPAFALLYLRRWGRFRWRMCAVYAGITWLILILFYDWVMNILFYPSLLYGLLQPLLPDFIPGWLIF